MPLPVLAGMAIGTALSAGAEYGVQSGLAKGNSKRALRQQQAYTDMAYNANARMAEYNQGLQLQSLQKSYGMQMKGMKDAGLNPALMYGTSGGGGTTTAPAQGIGTGQEHGETAIKMNVGMGMMQAAQIALLDSQKKNIDADTRNKEASAGKTQAETTTIPIQQENIKASTANLSQDVENKKAQQDLTTIQADLENTKANIATASAEAQVELIKTQLKQANQQLESMVRENSINEETKQTKINQIKADLTLTGVETQLKKQLTTQSQAEIQNMAKSITLKYDELFQNATNQNRETTIKEWHDFMQQQNIPIEVGEKLLNILGLRAILGGGERSIIQGFKSKY